MSVFWRTCPPRSMWISKSSRNTASNNSIAAATHQACWWLRVYCEWWGKIIDDSKLNQPNYICISICRATQLSFWFDFCNPLPLPCTFFVSLAYFNIFEFSPPLSLSLPLSLPRCVFETDKAGCFRLERNGWFLLSGKWRVISLKSITAPATAASKSAGLSGNKGGIQVILFGLSLMQQGVWLEEFHLCVSVIVFSADAALLGSHRLSHEAYPPVSLPPSFLV